MCNGSGVGWVWVGCYVGVVERVLSEMGVVWGDGEMSDGVGECWLGVERVLSEVWCDVGVESVLCGIEWGDGVGSGVGRWGREMG